MGREVKRVASDFEWPLEKTWEGYLNPWYKFRDKCPSCDGTGYSPKAKFFHDQWYGYVEFDPVAYGSELLTPETPALRAFVERQVDRSMKAAAEGTQMEYSRENGTTYTGTHCYYTNNGRLTRDEAILKECNRLLEMWNQQWNHHLIQVDVDALVKDDRLFDFIHRPLKGIPLEQYVRTHAYYLWEAAGRPEGNAEEFWLKSEELHKGHWLPYQNGYIPTAEEVNAWNILSMGHDGINCGVCIKARCEREGYSYLCSECGGDGDLWTPEDAKQKAEEWERTEPPAGEAYQIWETVSEGSPISPAFTDPRILAEWMANSKPWGAAQKMTADRWLNWIVGPGWAPSGIMMNGVYQDGVAALTEGNNESEISD